MESPSSDTGSTITGRNSSATAPSSPPPVDSDLPQPDFSSLVMDEKSLEEEEEQARLANIKAEELRRKALAKKRKNKNTKAESKAEREVKARQLDELLKKSAAFSDILTKKTQVLGRVGSSLDGKTLGEHSLEMAKQPKCVVGGVMRDYQLEGLTWMFEICSQGMSGILADEMGLGKTVQTISLIALLREQENYLGPHLIVAPLSTLSNWMDEFRHWTPSIPVTMYHGNQQQRNEIFKSSLVRHLDGQRPTKKFPVVCTSYEMVLRDQHNLSKIQWEFIIIDEGHRMKNAEAKLFQQLRQFSSATRLLITGTPLQNNLKELWSLLHFLLPNIFTNWDAFESWFDFSDLEDERGTQEFITDNKKQDLVKKIHSILQPLLLRRVKQDVASYLPKKREYVLFAPMTKEQTDLYNAITDKNINTRCFLEKKVTEAITSSKSLLRPTKRLSPVEDCPSTPASEMPFPLLGQMHLTMVGGAEADTRREGKEISPIPPRRNAFQLMMGKRASRTPARKIVKITKSSDFPIIPDYGLKRSNSPDTTSCDRSKSVRIGLKSSPASGRRKTRKLKRYMDIDSDEDVLSDDAFEAKLSVELSNTIDDESDKGYSSSMDLELMETLEHAKKQIAQKKLGNPLVQLRLVCNSPLNFYKPWATRSEAPVDDRIITTSGKMLLLDRLLPSLFERGHKVLIFSQFTTQLDILEEYCRELRGWGVCRIDGSVPQDIRRQQIRDFNKNLDFRIFLLSTRAGGQGINLASADTVILFDSDFNPQQDLQAQDRCHRIGQTRPVIVYRLATKGTVEETLLMSADAKRRLEKLVIRKGGLRTMGQKIDMQNDDESETLRALLLKDGLVYKASGGQQVLSDADLNALCDRSEEAYARAASGLGDAEKYRIVETGPNSIKMANEGHT